MTRKEAIIQAKSDWFNKNHYNDIEFSEFDIAEAFIEGAEWADKTMIEKACEWLRNNAADYNECESKYDEDTMVDFFRKAMEE